MIQVSMPAAFRKVFGKGESRRLRMNDITPAVVYSGGSEALNLQFEAGVLYKSLFGIHGQNAVITLTIDGDGKGERHVLVKEIQKNPVTDKLIHVDFMEIALDKPVALTVPLNYKGTAKGVDLGGEIQMARNTVRLRGCPLDIPDSIEVDISELDRGDRLAYSDIATPEKVKRLDGSDTVCVYVN